MQPEWFNFKSSDDLLYKYFTILKGSSSKHRFLQEHNAALQKQHSCIINNNSNSRKINKIS